MTTELGELRRGQVITTFGPGAIVDFRAPGKDGGPVSVVAAGLDQWDRAAPDAMLGASNEQSISEPRLQRLLKVKRFRLPPVVLRGDNGRYESADRLVGVRFPTWLFCADCHRLRRASAWGKPRSPWDPSRICTDCTRTRDAVVHALPARFVTICERGHLDEFPWDMWVQHRASCTKGGDLKLVGTGSGMRGLVLSCRGCGASRTMDGCFSPDALKHSPCRGQRPWLGDSEECGVTMRTVYRGASNVHFPVIVSALDVPPWSEDVFKKVPIVDWERIENQYTTDEERLQYISMTSLHTLVGLSSAEDLLAEVKARLSLLEGTTADSIRPDEHRAFLKGSASLKNRSFRVEDRPIASELTTYFSRIQSVTRLREVRVMRSFTRLVPPADWQDRPGASFARISREPREWLPAAEVNGEGIFLELEQKSLEQWENRECTKARAKLIRDAFEEDWRRRYGKDEPISLEVSPRFLLLHSLSHVLMRQLALESGYSSSSTRERLYVSTNEYGMCGLLLYTASSDADGTLGGLSRQAHPSRMLSLIVGGIRATEWCSNDPLCIQNVQSESEVMNGAACHSCLMSPETSCEQYNRLLDRWMLIGEPADRGVGFFSALLSL